jgi:hypothetical protein
MDRHQRQAHAQRILTDLDLLRREWEQTPMEPAAATQSVSARRERFKLLEAEASVLRLLQAERRLVQQVTLGLLVFAGGSVTTLLLKPLFGG